MSSDDLGNRMVKLETEVTQIRVDVTRQGIEAKERKGECRELMKSFGEELTKIRNNDLIHIKKELDAKIERDVISKTEASKLWAAILISLIAAVGSIVVAFIR